MSPFVFAACIAPIVCALRNKDFGHGLISCDVASDDSEPEGIFLRILRARGKDRVFLVFEEFRLYGLHLKSAIIFSTTRE